MDIPYSSLQAFDKVVIEYHGSGDEGYIEDIWTEPAIEGIALSDDLESDLEQIAYDILEQQCGGWEINEGSQGTITIDVKARKTVLNHGENRIETEYREVEIR